jgi:Ca2+-binding EF-hand superfamily protein
MRYALLTLPLYLLAGVAMAAPSASPAQIQQMVDRVMQADSNRDGMVTRAEWKTWRAAQFGRFDRNHDSYLSKADIPTFAMGGRKGDLFKEAMTDFDINHDQRLSHEEFVSGPMLAFDQIDLDHNGVIDGYEIKQAKAR